MNLKDLTQTYILEELTDIDLVKELQANLNRIGYDLQVDGIVGKQTLTAWAKFKKDRYLENPSEIGKSSIGILLKAPDAPKGKFALPTDGAGWISSPFGPRSMGFHKGIDIAVAEGVAIYAVAPGKVTNKVSGCSVGNYRCGGGYGNCVYLSHSIGEFNESRYAHLSRLAAGIDIGVSVKKGTLLGYAGNTGHSFGNHLHFEVRKQGKAFDPLLAINPIV